MSFNIIIFDSKTAICQDILQVFSNITYINIQLHVNQKSILEKLEQTDLIIIHFIDESIFELLTILHAKGFDNILILLENKPHTLFLNQFYKLNIFNFILFPCEITFIKQRILTHYLVLSSTQETLLDKQVSHSIINTITNPIFVTDSDTILFCNDALLNLLGFSSIGDINNTIKNIEELFRSKFQFSSNSNSNYRLTEELNTNWFSNVKNNNEERLCISDHGVEKTYTIGSSLINNSSTYIIQLKDITKEVEQELELTSLLYTDNITNLPNRTKLIEDLQNESLKIRSLAILDINSFKEINDFYGHKIGDFILKGIAEVITSTIRNHENVYLYKFPSDIYCLANLKSNKKEFITLIKLLIENIEKKVFLFDAHEIHTRITIGLSFSTKNNKLITADLALQAAKNDRKDYLVFYDKLDNINEYKNNMLWTSKLKNALLNDGIIVYYQPLINNKTLQVDKYECLVRMIDEDRIISPFFFLDISKKSNQYSKITRVVIEKSFKEFDNLPFEFGVNISYEDIESPDFLKFVKTKLQQYNVSNRVVFEILEDEGVKDYDVLINFINEVKKMGCKVAIDDFGSGYSNFEHILKMNIDFLKIDASLIKNIAKDENSYKVTKTIIDFAKNLNLKTIAEFVENKEIFDIVKKLGADYSQGYYFSEPISVPNIYNYKS